MTSEFRLFEKEAVNSGRQNELDLAKAVPILCLPFVHCFIECTADEGLTLSDRIRSQRGPCAVH